MKLPTVSVIVLNFNGLRYLEDCLGSLSRLAYPEDRLELVLADNASSDGSVAFVRERYPHVRIIQFPENYGFSAGYNRAAAQVGSDYVAFLNTDMRVEPDWLSGLMNALDGETGAVCAGSKILSWDGRLIDFGGTLLSFLGHGRGDGYRDSDLAAYDDVRYILAPCGGAMLIDRAVFLEAGAFDEDFAMYYEDLDLGWRLWIMGYQVVFAPTSVCYHVHYGTAGSLPPARMNYLYARNAVSTIIKNYEQQYLDRVLPLALLMQLKRAYLLAQMSGLDMDRGRFRLATARQELHVSPPDYNARYYLREARETLRSQGLTALLRKALDEVDRRRGRPVAPHPEDLAAVPDNAAFWQAVAEITAANDTADTMGAMLKKRTEIQGRRRRSDAEIFRTVRALSFGVCFDVAEYREAQKALIEAFAIPALFGEAYDTDVPFA